MLQNRKSGGARACGGDGKEARKARGKHVTNQAQQLEDCDEELH